jgi:hypothetical protein
MVDNIWRTVMVLAVLTGLPTAAHAQQTSEGAAIRPISLHELVLKDGSRMYGSVEAESDTEVVFITQSGARVTARRGDVLHLRRVSGSMIDGEFAPADPNSTRLFFAPTGRSLKKGQTYLGVYEFLIPFVQVGVTDRLSVGGGTPLLFGFDNGARPFWVTPKFQVVNAGKTQASIGVMHAFSTGWDDGDSHAAGIAYGVLTHGDDVKAVTAGAGMGYAGDGGKAAIFMIGAEGRVRRNIKAITENYI